MTIDQSNTCHFSGRFCTFSKINTYLTIYRSKYHEMWFTKSSSSCINFSFFWLLDCYQISILPPLQHGENCCTISDKIHFKNQSIPYPISMKFLQHFLWWVYNMHTKFQAISNRFGHLNSDLISASSVFQFWTDFKQLSYTCSNWIKLEINLIEYIHKTYIHSIILVSSWSSI